MDTFLLLIIMLYTRALTDFVFKLEREWEFLIHYVIMYWQTLGQDLDLYDHNYVELTHDYNYYGTMATTITSGHYGLLTTKIIT